MRFNENQVLDIMKKSTGATIEKKSLTPVPHGFLGVVSAKQQIICITDGACAFADRLECERDEYKYGVRVRVAPMNGKNSQVLRLFLKWTAPHACQNTASLGLEDTFGLALPLFAQSFAEEQIRLVLQSDFASPEKLARATGKAAWQALEHGLNSGYAAEFAYAASEEEIVSALMCGYTGIVVDCTDKIISANLQLADEEALTKFQTLSEDFQAALRDYYSDKSFLLGQWGKITYSPQELARVALGYGETIAYIQYIYHAYFKNAPWPVDFSLYLGKDDLSPYAHYLLANELSRVGVKVAAIEISPLSQSFTANSSVAAIFEQKLRIVLTMEHREYLSSWRPVDRCLFDLRSEKDSSLLSAFAFLRDAGEPSFDNILTGSETAEEKIAIVYKVKENMPAALEKHGDSYRQLLTEEINKDKDLLKKLLS